MNRTLVQILVVVGILYWNRKGLKEKRVPCEEWFDKGKPVLRRWEIPLEKHFFYSITKMCRRKGNRLIFLCQNLDIEWQHKQIRWRHLGFREELSFLFNCTSLPVEFRQEARLQTCKKNSLLLNYPKRPNWPLKNRRRDLFQLWPYQ